VTHTDSQGRALPPEDAGELETLIGFLEFQRATFDWKSSGLDEVGLNTSVAPSAMTLGGLMKHLAFVEEHWFSYRLFHEGPNPPWDTVDWSADRDWDWHSASENSPKQLRALWQQSIERSRTNLARALADGGLDFQVRLARENDAPNLRWVLCHMVEEYARHNGHADYLREAVDGVIGE
jgi:hypothetical protein